MSKKYYNDDEMYQLLALFALEDCIGMVCADCPTHCATCAAERAEACRVCGEDAYELVADGLCGPCLSVALADRQADRDYEERAGK